MQKYTQNEIVVLVNKVLHHVQIPLHWNYRGPKIYTTRQLIALLILKARENKSLRRFVSWLKETKWPEWLKLKEIPSYVTIHRALKRFNLSILREINKVIVSFLSSKKKALDSTGIDVIHRSKHYERRVGLFRERFPKLDILGDIENYLIEDWNFKLKERHDIIGAKSIIKRAKKVDSIDLWADKAYDSEELHQLAHNKGFTLLAPTRKSPRKKPRGFFRRLVDKRIKEKDKNERPKVETIFSILKRVYGETIRARLGYMKKREMAWKIIVMNVEKVIKILVILYLIKNYLKQSLKYCWYHTAGYRQLKHGGASKV